MPIAVRSAQTRVLRTAGMLTRSLRDGERRQMPDLSDGDVQPRLERDGHNELT